MLNSAIVCFIDVLVDRGVNVCGSGCCYKALRKVLRVVTYAGDCLSMNYRWHIFFIRYYIRLEG